MIPLDSAPEAGASPRAQPLPSDPAVAYRTATDSPGGLRSEVVLQIQTRQAQRLVLGRAAGPDKPAIIGLVRFGMIVRRIWDSAARDDPYADAALLRILEALEQGREDVNQRQQRIQNQLDGVDGIAIGLAQTLTPVRIPLNFANPYGYMGAYLICDFDRLARTLLTARHVGMLDRDTSERMLYQGGRKVRRAFAAAQAWRHCAVTRADLLADNARARSAIEAMGTLPPDVIQGETRPRIAPDIRKPSRATDEQINPLKASARTGEKSHTGEDGAEGTRCLDEEDDDDDPARPTG
ncbi:TIGR03761 family integrating conjugative element protein [Ectothiorhodospira haloalkaliphila]|uniref:PFL_4669 family integrating conjugative element protein n=1 Tax=Ectothiorhodospira haloalkaliphila TaxID=421628 RepID=UPI001EE89981|nr:TIGR03761 family integrating conjugative element protein [Ectothiorhodospira haloalkaliphila]MCG5526395.1 TIGR03761 family integrating conjugative element protein [Ectothiorhodospira haloalkaliphila]